jgi:hypothetical protein
MLIGINGVSKSGKDTLADMLSPFKSVKVALADEMKRLTRKVYPAMTIEHLWGPSEKRNEKILEYPRKNHVFTKGEEILRECACCGEKNDVEAPQCYLTPRYALQMLGTEWGRNNYLDTWVEILLGNAVAILSRGFSYKAPSGVLWEMALPKHAWYEIVAVPDIRYKNEMEAIRANGGKLWRIKRAGSGLKGAMAKHNSETEQLEVPDEYFDLIFDNNSTLEALQMHLEYAMKG